jgi:hypothetical protein
LFPEIACLLFKGLDFYVKLLTLWCEDGGNKFLRNVGIACQTTRPHNPDHFKACGIAPVSLRHVHSIAVT